MFVAIGSTRRLLPDHCGPAARYLAHERMDAGNRRVSERAGRSFSTSPDESDAERDPRRIVVAAVAAEASAAVDERAGLLRCERGAEPDLIHERVLGRLAGLLEAFRPGAEKPSSPRLQQTLQSYARLRCSSATTLRLLPQEVNEGAKPPSAPAEDPRCWHSSSDAMPPSVLKETLATLPTRCRQPRIHSALLGASAILSVLPSPDRSDAICGLEDDRPRVRSRSSPSDGPKIHRMVVARRPCGWDDLGSALSLE